MSKWPPPIFADAGNVLSRTVPGRNSGSPIGSYLISLYRSLYTPHVRETQRAWTITKYGKQRHYGSRKLFSSAQNTLRTARVSLSASRRELCRTEMLWLNGYSGVQFETERCFVFTGVRPTREEVTPRVVRTRSVKYFGLLKRVAIVRKSCFVWIDIER